MDTDSITIPNGETGGTAGVPDATRQPAGPSLPMNSTWRCIVVLSAVAYWGAIFVGTHMRMPAVLDDLPENSDKLMHFVSYGGLAFLLGLWRGAYRELTARDYLIVFSITAMYAVVDELLQLIPVLNRSCDPLDVLADCIGSLCGLAVLRAFVPIYRRLATGYAA